MNDGEHREWFEVSDGTVEHFEFCGGLATVFSQRCPNRKTSVNEDAGSLFQVSSRKGLLAVADGMGGANAGDKAAKSVIRSIVSKVKSSSAESNESLRSDVLDAIESSNRQILGWGVGAGATLAAVEYSSGKLRSFHVGDAQAMLVSNRGRIKFATVGHAPVAMAVEIGVLDEMEAMHHGDRNLISNCLGSTDMKIELGPSLKMAKRDTLVIASDGLYDNLTTTEIAQMVRTGKLVKQTQSLVDLVTSRMASDSEPQRDDNSPSKPDDLTVICFRQYGDRK